MERPRLKRTVEAIETARGDVYLLRPSTGTDLVIERPDAEVRGLLAALDGSRSLAELERSFDSARVAEAIDQLAAFELLEDAADDERIPPAELERFDRQLRYMSDVGGDGRLPSEYQARLRESRVAVLGVGGLGSWAAYGLACCGIGELLLIDGDRVEPSNFNRQILYREKDLGRPKTAAAAETLAAFSSQLGVRTLPVRLDSVDAVRRAVAGWDLVVNAADWPAHDIERWVNQACFQAGLPYISMSHFPPMARVGPLYVPGETGCFACQETAYRRTYPLYDEVVAARRARPSGAATLGPVCAFVGGQVALEVLHQLTGLCTPATKGRAWIYDLRTMEAEIDEVVREADCPVCDARPGCRGYSRG